MSEKVIVDLDKLRARMLREPTNEEAIDLLFALIEDQRRQVVEARDDAAAYKYALKEIDQTPVGACETLAGDIEPCDACGEMRTIAENALSKTGQTGDMLAMIAEARQKLHDIANDTAGVQLEPTMARDDLTALRSAARLYLDATTAMPHDGAQLAARGRLAMFVKKAGKE